jgi:hypothetical protein
VIIGKMCQSQFQDLDLGSVDVPDGTDHAPIVGEGGGHEPVSGSEVRCPTRSIEEGVAKRRITGLALGRAYPDRKVNAEYRIGVGCLRVEVESLGVVKKGISRSKSAEGGVSCLPRVPDGLGEINGMSGAQPVTGQFTDPALWALPTDFLQGLCDAPMCPSPEK